MDKPLGILIFPKIADAPTFKREPWTLSDKARAAIEEIEAQQRRSWREIMTGNFWLD